VIAVDTDERRRKLAGELGADEVLEGGGNVADAVREATDGAGADVVIDFVGNDATHEAGIAMLARRGVYAIVGYGGTVTCPSPVLVSRETTIMASLVGSWIDLWDVVQLQASGRLTLKTETHPLEDVNEVLAKLRDGDVTGRAVLVP
jgi:NAD+-dependent secondary alcohol dehydrogenase Adh1